MILPNWSDDGKKSNPNFIKSLEKVKKKKINVKIKDKQEGRFRLGVVVIVYKNPFIV